MALLSQAVVSSPDSSAQNTTSSYGLFAWIYGIGLGGYHYALKMFVYQRVRPRNFARAWSFVQAAQALPLACGIPLAGKPIKSETPVAHHNERTKYEVDDEKEAGCILTPLSSCDSSRGEWGWLARFSLHDFEKKEKRYLQNFFTSIFPIHLYMYFVSSDKIEV